MPETLAPILANKAAAGGIVSALKLARWACANPNIIAGQPYTSLAFYRSWQMARDLIWDVVDDLANAGRSHGHADAIVEALGLTGVMERVNAVDHHQRSRPAAAAAIAAEVDRQLAGAIDRLTAGLAESATSSK